MLITIISVVSAACLNASTENKIDVFVYREIKDECYHFIYNIHRNLQIWKWPNSLVKDTLKIGLEDYLMKHLNTPESRTLYLKYEAMDWNIHEMVKMHLSCED